MTSILAAVLLTGGASRRMGFDKALLPVGGAPNALRLGRLLASQVSLALEVGPGRSGLPWVTETLPGGGPLVAMGAGAAALRARGHEGPALVLACDLPLVDEAVVGFLARWPVAGSVVPVVGGHPQPLCARWSAEDLQAAHLLAQAGERSMKALLRRPGISWADEACWPPGVTAASFADADTPADVARLGLPS